MVCNYSIKKKIRKGVELREVESTKNAWRGEMGKSEKMKGKSEVRTSRP